MNILYFVKQNSLYKKLERSDKSSFYLHSICLLLLLPTILVLVFRFIQRVFYNKKYQYQLGIVVIAKNESEYIQEWCAFHKAVGVEKILLFDNESSDNMKELLQPFIHSGFVEYYYWKGRAQQLSVYNEGLKLGKKRFKYLAFIDCDEYLYSVDRNQSLLETIDFFFSKHKLAGGTYVNWKMFGSCGYISKPHGLCIEAFTKRALPGKAGTRWGKTILKTSCSNCYCYPHYPLYNWGYAGYDQFGNIVPDWKNEIKTYGTICLNHYFCKSKDQWKFRREIVGDVNGLSADDNRKMEEFYEHDNNDVEDLSACFYIDDVKQILSKIG